MVGGRAVKREGASLARRVVSELALPVRPLLFFFGIRKLCFTYLRLKQDFAGKISK